MTKQLDSSAIDDITVTSFVVAGSAFGMTSSAKDVPCLVGPPKHNWYEIGIYWKCSKCGMSYETTPEKGLRL